MPCRVELPMIYPHDDSQVTLGRGGRDHHPPRAGFEMAGRPGAVDKETGCFEDQIDSQAGPRQLLRPGEGEIQDLFAVYVERRVAVLYPAAESARHRIVTEKVGSDGRSGKVVDRRDLDPRNTPGPAKKSPADSAEAIDCHPDCHYPFSLCL